MIELIYGICILMLIIGTITDIKVREVPDWLNYSGIFIGLGLRLMWSLGTFDWSYIIEGGIGFGVFLGAALAMFYLGQWGGGDSKMLMALGALLGLKFDFNHIAVAFVINLIIVGGLYGIAYSIGLAFKNWKKFKKMFLKLRQQKNYLKAKKYVVIIMLVLFVISIFVSDARFRILFLLPAVLVGVLYYMVLIIKSVEQCCMYKWVSPKELTEGDWIVHDIKVKGKRICGPKDLGIEKKQINQLVKARIKQVLIKVGIPFVPSFLIAFGITLWIGNPLVYFV